MRVVRAFAFILVICLCGCGGFAARRLAQAPNTYPKWLAPKAPVTLDFSEKLLTAFTNHYLEISSPAARIRYRVIEPANYSFHWTNQLDENRGELSLSFSAQVNDLAQRTNRWTAAPRGTAVLLHGYGVAGFAMLPWAFLLGQEGWRCILVDLRGHGKSTGKRIYFGTQEVSDLRALLDQLERDGQLRRPVAVIGHSFGAVLALRWELADPRVSSVVALSPYADLEKAILSVSDQYAHWVPKSFLRAGLRKLPELLHASPDELNPEEWVSEFRQKDLKALFIAGGADKIAPVDLVEELDQLAGPASPLLVVPNAAHEPLPFYFDDLTGPITEWISRQSSAKARSTAAVKRPKRETD